MFRKGFTKFEVLCREAWHAAVQKNWLPEAKGSNFQGGSFLQFPYHFRWGDAVPYCQKRGMYFCQGLLAFWRFCLSICFGQLYCLWLVLLPQSHPSYMVILSRSHSSLCLHHVVSHPQAAELQRWALHLEGFPLEGGRRLADPTSSIVNHHPPSSTSLLLGFGLFARLNRTTFRFRPGFVIKDLPYLCFTLTECLIIKTIPSSIIWTADTHFLSAVHMQMLQNNNTSIPPKNEVQKILI